MTCFLVLTLCRGFLVVFLIITWAVNLDSFLSQLMYPWTNFNFQSCQLQKIDRKHVNITPNPAVLSMAGELFLCGTKETFYLPLI